MAKRVASKKLVDPLSASHDAGSPTIRGQTKAEQLHGCYLPKTNRTDISGDEIWRFYVLHTRAEKAFRDMQSPLAERPIFHQREERVEAHIFLCALAYHHLVSIERTLLDSTPLGRGARYSPNPSVLRHRAADKQRRAARAQSVDPRA